MIQSLKKYWLLFHRTWAVDPVTQEQGLRWCGTNGKAGYEMLASGHDTTSVLALPVQINIPAWTEEQPMRPTP